MVRVTGAGEEARKERKHQVSVSSVKEVVFSVLSICQIQNV